MEVLFGLFFHVLHYGCILAMAAGAAWLLRRVMKKRFAPLLVLCIAAELGILGWLAYHPVVLTPRECAPYVTAEVRKDIASFNSGFGYNRYIPASPVCCLVTAADGDRVEVTTVYLYFWVSRMEISNGVPGQLWPQG